MTVLVLSATVLLAIVGLGLGAIYLGMQDRAGIVREAADLHYDRALVHLARQEYELAIAELELVLQLNPEHGAGRERLREAQAGLSRKPSPTPVLKEALNVAYFAQLAAAHEAQEWPRVVETADRLWAQDPSHRRDEVEAMLFDAFYLSGLRLVGEGRLEEAIRMIDRGLALRPDHEEAMDQRDKATLYVSGMSFWQADWAAVLDRLQLLYAQNPEYLDVRERVYEAAASYGEQFGAAGDWCGAVPWFDLALEVTYRGEVAVGRDDAATRCAHLLAGAPDPEGTPRPAAASGTYVGRIVEQMPLDSDKIYIRGRVIDRSGQGVAGVAVQIRAWDWSTTHHSDGSGQFSFDGLNHATTYSISLASHPSMPLDTPGEWGKITWVVFEEVR